MFFVSVASEFHIHGASRTFRSLRILIIGQIYNCLAGPVCILLIMTKQFKESALSSIFSLFLSFVFAYVLNGFMGLLSIPPAIITSLFINNSLDIINPNP